MSGSEENDRDLQRVRDAANALIEHFDSVHIFATRHEAERGGTIKWQLGKGNWYARYGQIVEWVTQENQSSRNAVRPDNE